ncbi:MAG TPA: hypothetical protein VJ773_03285 [Gemmatimonadales bacterium]|nr:hypothetical protein [Gemmatimonadales bacterium]
MADLHEHDGMTCRSCGREERASEGYPCAGCGTFLCLVCTFRGVTRCAACRGEPLGDAPVPGERAG